MNLSRIQTALQEANIDCWLIYDFQNTNPVLANLFTTRKLHLSRRVFVIIPAHGEPHVLGSKIDQHALAHFNLPTTHYISWRAMQSLLQQALAPYQTIGMDYSPMGELPTVSRVDAGTVEYIRSLEKEVVSAANVFQAAAAIWDEGVLEAHLEDCAIVATIKDEAFAYIAEQLQMEQSVNEYQVQQFIMARFDEENLFTPYPPIVAVNAHSGDPHYIPSAEAHAPILADDWILLDLWAKRVGYQYVFADMTWVAVAGSRPTAAQQRVFEVVTGARDAAVSYLQRQTAAGEAIFGWQVDDVTRHHISAAGYGEAFIHRTGHSLGPGNIPHGLGANIDNLETHDTRRLSPGIGFSIEPGVYLPEFGIRSEINVAMQVDGPLVTTPIQDKIICLK